jgi:PST family polysaccharide transporter
LPLSMPCSWLFTSQGRGSESFVLTMILCALTVAAFIIGLPFGPAGVAISFSVSGLAIRLPIIYYFVGRRGPVRTMDLWVVFFRHLPLWVVVFGVTYLTRTLLVNFEPLVELFICAPVGVAAGVGTIVALRPLRMVALHILRTVTEVWVLHRSKLL